MEFLEAQAVAHDAGGRPLPARADGYRLRATWIGRSAGPCVMVTVSPRGTVFLSPAVRNQKMGTDLLRSRDGGRTFELVETPRPYRGTPPGYRLRIVNLLPQYFRWLSKRLPNGCTMHPSCIETPYRAPLRVDHDEGRLRRRQRVRTRDE